MHFLNRIHIINCVIFIFKLEQKGEVASKVEKSFNDVETQTDFAINSTIDDNWLNVDGNNKISVVEQVKEVAENALKQTGFVYEETSGLYYDYNSGYYYDAVRV